MVPTEDIIKMMDLVHKNNLFEFDCKFADSKYQARVLGLNMSHCMLAFSWTILKRSS